MSSNTQASVGMLEFTGAGVDKIRQEMQDSEARMVLLGARFFEASKQAAEAAETYRLRYGADAATLLTIARTLSAGLTQALQWASDWAGLTGEVEVSINEEFLPEPMTPEEIKARLELYLSGAMTFSDLISELQRGQVIPGGRTPEEIRAELETEPPPGLPSTLTPGSGSQDDDDDDDETDDEEDDEQ
jgi:hypothetical protein